MNCTEKTWHELITPLWQASEPPHLWGDDVDADWNTLSEALFDTLTKAAETLRPDLMSHIPRGLLRRGKPSTLRFTPMRVPAGPNASYKEIRLTRQLGRLREISRLIGLDQDPPQILWTKLKRSPFYNPRENVHRSIVHTQRLLDECFAQRKRTALTHWKEKMTADKSAFAWLRKDPQAMTHAVKLSPGDRAASSVHEALRKIQEYWRPCGPN